MEKQHFFLFGAEKGILFNAIYSTVNNIKHTTYSSFIILVTF